MQIVKRTDVPNAWQIGTRAPNGPKVRLHSGGTLFFSVMAAELFGTEDCKVLAEYDEAARTLKFTAVDGKLPRGVSPEDCFPMRIRTQTHGRRKIGMISIRALLTYIGFQWSGGKGQDFDVKEIDRAARSITLALP
jgi:hypothetical protein